MHLHHTLNSSESIWPPPVSTGVFRNEEPSPEVQRDKEISLGQFILSLFEGVGQLLPEDCAGLLMSRPSSSQLGTPVAKRCRRGFQSVYRVSRHTWSPWWPAQVAGGKIRKVAAALAKQFGLEAKGARYHLFQRLFVLLICVLCTVR